MKRKRAPTVCLGWGSLWGLVGVGDGLGLGYDVVGLVCAPRGFLAAGDVSLDVSLGEVATGVREGVTVGVKGEEVVGGGLVVLNDFLALCFGAVSRCCCCNLSIGV